MREPRINPLVKHLNDRDQHRHQRECGNDRNRPSRNPPDHPDQQTTTPVHGHPSHSKQTKATGTYQPPWTMHQMTSYDDKGIGKEVFTYAGNPASIHTRPVLISRNKTAETIADLQKQKSVTWETAPDTARAHPAEADQETQRRYRTNPVFYITLLTVRPYADTA